MGRNPTKEGYINPEREVEKSIQETANWGSGRGGRSSETQLPSHTPVNKRN